MAGTIKGITIELDGKSTKLTAALKEVNTPAKNLQSNLKSVNAALKLDPSSTELLSEKQKILASYVDVTKDKLKTLESVQDQIKQQYASGEIDQGAYLDFRKELEQTKAKLKDLKELQKEFGSVVQQQMELAGQKVSDFGNKISDAGGALTKNVTAPVVAVGTAAVAAFDKVDDGVDTIIKATGASGETLGSLEDSYKKIASELPADFDVIAAAVGEVNTRFHTTGEELENQTRMMLKFSEITGTDVVQATDDADKILKTYGKSADDLQGFLGLVAQKSQQTGISAQTLMQDVEKNAASFKELGFTLEQSIGLLTQMDENGVDTSTALSSLKKAVTKLTESGMEQNEALREVIGSIKTAETETEALQIAQETFGTKGAAEMATAIREGRLDIDALSESMADCASVVDDTFANTVGDASDEAKTAINALTVAGSELGGTISEMLAPIIMNVSEMIRDLTKKWKGLNDGQKQSIIRIAAVVAAIGPCLTIGGKLISGIGSAIKVLGSLGTALNFLAANPVVLIVAAIAGIVAILVTAYNKCEWFRDGVNKVIGVVVSSFGHLWEGIREVWEKIIQSLQPLIDAICGAFKEGWELIQAIWDFVGQYFSAVWDGIKAVFGVVKDYLAGVFLSAWEAIKLVWNAVIDYFTAIWNTIKGIFSVVKSVLTGDFQGAWDGIKGIFSTWGSFFNGLIDNIRNTFSRVVSIMTTPIESATKLIKSAFDKIKSFVNFKWELPKLKLPHFSISGSFSLDPPSIPKIGIEWYAKGGILNGAQIFGALGRNLLGGGEAGPEAVLPLSGFYDNLRSILTQFLGSVSSGNGLLVNLYIDRFENDTDRDIEELAEFVADKIHAEVQRREVAL